MIHCVEGEGWLKIGGQEHIVKADKMACIPAGAPHWYGADADNPWSAYWIHMTGRQAGEYFQFLGASVERPLLHLSDSREILAAFEETWALMKAVHTAANLILASIGLTRYLGRSAARCPPPKAGPAPSISESRKRSPSSPRTSPREVSLAELANLAATLRQPLHRRFSPGHRLFADGVFQPSAGAAGV